MSASPYPRPIPMNWSLFRSVLRCCEIRKLSINTIDIRSFDLKSLVKSTVWANILVNFREFKVNKITVHCVPDAGTSTAGIAALIVIDDQQSNITASSSFQECISIQGCIVRKVYSPMARSWVPTEPTDREWRQTVDTWKILNVVIATSSMSATNAVDGTHITYDVTIDIDIKFRGNLVTTKLATVDGAIVNAQNVRDREDFNEIDTVSPMSSESFHLISKMNIGEK